MSFSFNPEGDLNRIPKWALRYESWLMDAMFEVTIFKGS